MKKLQPSINGLTCQGDQNQERSISLHRNLQANQALGQNNAVMNHNAASNSVDHNQRRISGTAIDCYNQNFDGQFCTVANTTENQISVRPEQMYNNGFASSSRNRRKSRPKLDRNQCKVCLGSGHWSNDLNCPAK